MLPASEADNALYEAILEQDLDACVEALNSGANPNAYTFPRAPEQCLLTCAIDRGFTAGVLLLLERGADARGSVESGIPIHSAALEGNTEVCRALVLNGADVNQRDDGMRTPLHRAAVEAEVGTLEELIALGADVHAADKDGYLPLHYVVISDRSRTVDALRTLITKGARFDYECEDADDDCLARSETLTPFQMAVQRRKHSCVASLLNEHGADPLQRTRGGKSMLELAGDEETSCLIASATTETTLRKAIAETERDYPTKPSVLRSFNSL